MADRLTNPVIEIGTMKGLVITMTRSRSSRFKLITQEFDDGGHIALSTSGGIKWTDRPDVCGEQLLVHFKKMVRKFPDLMDLAFQTIFPEYWGMSLSEFGFQTASNDADSGTCDDIHAHVMFALKETWGTGAIPRIVDPIDPVPVTKRNPRKNA